VAAADFSTQSTVSLLSRYARTSLQGAGEMTGVISPYLRPVRQGSQARDALAPIDQKA
jgi:hypothetical protein